MNRTTALLWLLSTALLWGCSGGGGDTGGGSDGGPTGDTDQGSGSVISLPTAVITTQEAIDLATFEAETKPMMPSMAARPLLISTTRPRSSCGGRPSGTTRS